MIVANVGRDAVDAAAPARKVIAGWVSRERSTDAQDERRQSPVEPLESPKSDFGRRRLAKTGCCVRQKRVVLAPVAGVKLAEAKSVQPRLISLNPPTTATRRIRRRGERAISRKAIPCSLLAENVMQTSGKTCREKAKPSPRRYLPPDALNLSCALG
jgi:hypothetical protein